MKRITATPMPGAQILVTDDKLIFKCWKFDMNGRLFTECTKRDLELAVMRHLRKRLTPGHDK